MGRIEKPRSIREALALWKRGDAAFLGGGTRLNSPAAWALETLISLELLGLERITQEGSSLRIGAAVTFQRIVDDQRLPGGLRCAAALTASRTLRNMQTLGGEVALCRADSAVIPVLAALGARVITARLRGGAGMEAWLAAPSEDLILEILIKNAGLSCSVRAVSRGSHGARSLVVAVSALSAKPTLESVFIAAGDCVGPFVRLRAVEKALQGKTLPPKERIEERVKNAWEPRADIHASAEYKRYIAGVAVADLLHGIGGAR
jgi:putative selenate reductase FAD-binding subunit